MFAYCNNNPVLLVDSNGEFGVVGLAVLGGVAGGLISYAGQVVRNVSNGENGLDAFARKINWGKVASSTFSGVLSAVPCGTLLGTVYDAVGSAVIEHGLNYVLGAQWDTAQLCEDILYGAVASKLVLNLKMPRFIRDIKDEARAIGIKGTKRLTNYLNLTQTITTIANAFANDTFSYLHDGAKPVIKRQIQYMVRS